MDIDIMAVMECAEYVIDKMDKRYVIVQIVTLDIRSLGKV